MRAIVRYVILTNYWLGVLSCSTPWDPSQLKWSSLTRNLQGRSHARKICTWNLWLCHQLITKCVCVHRVTVDVLKCAVAMANRSWQSVASGSAIWVDLTAKPSAGLEATRRACFWISSVSITRGRLCLVLGLFRFWLPALGRAANGADYIVKATKRMFPHFYNLLQLTLSTSLRVTHRVPYHC